MPDTHDYYVQAAGEPGRGHRVEGASHEDAAMTYAELWAPRIDGDLEVIVEDADSGRRCCYRIDLGTGDAEPCV